jgi:hypothetical protein
VDDELMQQILTRLGGGQPEGSTDPLMTALLGSLAGRRTERADDQDDDRVRAELARARRANARLKEAVRTGDSMALYISDVFGCCQVCWGLNRLCATCRGEGGPGYRHPDAERLLEWVVPALRRIDLDVVPAKTPPVGDTTMDGRSDT